MLQTKLLDEILALDNRQRHLAEPMMPPNHLGVGSVAGRRQAKKQTVTLLGLIAMKAVQRHGLAAGDS